MYIQSVMIISHAWDSWWRCVCVCVCIMIEISFNSGGTVQLALF